MISIVSIKIDTNVTFPNTNLKVIGLSYDFF